MATLSQYQNTKFKIKILWIISNENSNIGAYKQLNTLVHIFIPSLWVAWAEGL